MRISIVFLVTVLFTGAIYGQKLQDIEAIKLNTKFTLQLNKGDSNNFPYKIISTEPFEGELESSSFKLLDEDLNNNQIQGILGIGTFGSQRSVQLLIKSGGELPLIYELFIDRKGNDRFKKTSTIQLIPGVPSQEIWPYNIHAIKIGNFQKPSIIKETESVLDTTCYSTLDIHQGNTLINEQLTFLSEIISNQEESVVDKIKNYEDSIKSISISSWGWGDELNILDKNGRKIGEHVKRKKIKEILVYKLTECPYLSREVGYFFSKKDRKLKCVVFKWRQRWVGGWQSRAYQNIEDDYRSKYGFLNKSLNEVLGSPTSSFNKENRRHKNIWVSNQGMSAESYLYIDQYSRSLRLKIYFPDE